MNFGNQFTGDARWLEVAVQCPGDGGPTTLTPRQALSATPYALSLQPGAVISGPIFFGAELWLQNNDQLGYGLISQGGYIGAYVSSISGTGVYGVCSAGTGVVGSSNSTFGVYGSTYTGTAGVYGQTARPNGSGVEGHANGDRAAGTYGVNPNGPGAWGISTNGNGVYGETSAAHTITYSAVYGRSYGNGGIGGIGEGGAGNSWGVYGISSGGVAVNAASDSGTGVNGASGSGIGVNGASSSNFGVKGTSTSASAGVYGQCSGASAAGVWGFADADAGAAGVYGTNNNGVGVWGRNRSATGFAQRADGNAMQERAYGGWAKAMALIKDDGTISLCYNSQTSGAAISTPPCGFSTTHPATGNYVVDFGFQVSDRFISLTPRCFTSAGSCLVDVTAVVTGIANANQSRSYFRSLGGGGAIDTGFFIFVY